MPPSPPENNRTGSLREWLLLVEEKERGFGPERGRREMVIGGDGLKRRWWCLERVLERVVEEGLKLVAAIDVGGGPN